MFEKQKWREIVFLATPVVISKLSFTAMGLVDTAMVGRLGAASQAAVGIATTYMFTLYVFGLGLIGVVNTLVSQYSGAGNRKECGSVLGHGLFLATCIGLVTWIILYFSEPLFYFVGFSDDVANLGYTYLFYRILGLLPVFWYWTYNAFLEGLGHTRTPMFISIAGNLVNAALDYAFIFGYGPIPPMGVEGAGLATAIGNGFMLVCFAFVVHRPGNPYRAYGSGQLLASRSRPMVNKMIKMGFPMGAQFFLEVGAYLAFAVIVGWVGDIPLAANQIAMRAMSTSFMVAWGIGVAATTLVGRYQGKGQSDMAAAAGIRTILLMLGYSIVCGIIFVSIPGHIGRLFTPIEPVQELVVSLMYLAAIFQLFDGVNMVGYGALKGAGDTRWPLWTVIGVHWIFGIPAVYFLTIVAKLGVVGTWIGMTGMMGLQGGLILYRFVGKKWMGINIVNPTDK